MATGKEKYTRRFLFRRRGACVLVLAVAALMLAGVGRASAATLTVCPSGCAYTTIQDALTAASNGDKIGIGPGTYNGGFTISKSVKLIGAGAASTTISLSGAAGGAAVSVSSGASVVIGAVTISGPDLICSSCRGIYNGGSLTLNDSAVSRAFRGGGGIVNVNAATLTLNNSAVSGSEAPRGGGILNEGGTVTLNASTVSRSGSFSGGGGIINGLGGTLTLKESTVSGNNAFISGGGIFNSGTLTLKESTFSANTPDDCSGC